MSIINGYFSRTPRIHCRLFPRIICKDGFSVSVQANEYAYCSPRHTFDVQGYSQYYSMELGFPTAGDDSLTQYMDGDPETTDPTNTVYGYVPAEVVDALIEKHGGLDEEAMAKDRAEKGRL